MSHAQPNPAGSSPLLHTLSKIVGWLVVLACISLVPVSCISLNAGVQRDLGWAQCDVTEAVAQQHHGSWRLVLESTDCPPLSYTDGVTPDNAQDLASTIEPGPWEVRVHASALTEDGYLGDAEEIELYSYRPAPADGAIDPPSGF